MKGSAQLPECNSIRRGRGWAEPEIWFRILHVALDGHNGAPVAAYREQRVEIALGPEGAFESGNIGTCTRRVPADRVREVEQGRVGVVQLLDLDDDDRSAEPDGERQQELGDGVDGQVEHTAEKVHGQRGHEQHFQSQATTPRL